MLSFLNGETFIHLFIILSQIIIAFLQARLCLKPEKINLSHNHEPLSHTLFITVVIDALGTMTTPAKTTGL